MLKRHVLWERIEGEKKEWHRPRVSRTGGRMERTFQSSQGDLGWFRPGTGEVEVKEVGDIS